MPNGPSLLELNRAVIRAEAGGKTIWQPRIGCWLDDRRHDGIPLEEGMLGYDEAELYDRLGCSDRLYVFNSCLEATYDPSVKITRKQLDPLTEQVWMETPEGTLTSISRGNTTNFGIMPIKWLVETEEDLKVLCYIEEGMTFSFNQAEYDKLYKKWAHLGLPTVFLPRTTLQRLYLDMMGIEAATFALMDYPDTVEAYFKVLTESQDKLLKVVCESPFEWVNYGDNLHGGTLPPVWFQKYLLPAYQHRNQILGSAGIRTFSHWDGDCKALLPFAQETGLWGIEAITPLPQGDVTLPEVKQALGEMFLVDGVAAILFSDTFPVEALRRQVEEVLHLFEGQLVLGISDELPSDGLLDRVRLVRDWVDDFNAKH